jgi:hypothetical protein
MGGLDVKAAIRLFKRDDISGNKLTKKRNVKIIAVRDVGYHVLEVFNISGGKKILVAHVIQSVCHCLFVSILP